jgi:hypothetical protein
MLQFLGLVGELGAADVPDGAVRLPAPPSETFGSREEGRRPCFPNISSWCGRP